MNGLGGGIMNVILFPFRIFKTLFSLVSVPFKFIMENVEIERKHESNIRKFYNRKKRSRRLNDEII